MSRHPDAQTILQARAELAAADPAVARMNAVVEPFEWRALPAGFATLLRMIMSQQVSTASADAIWRRLEAGLGEVTPASVLAMTMNSSAASGCRGRRRATPTPSRRRISISTPCRSSPKRRSSSA
jgi:DNA-3-methyladenine glycosylase II